MQVNSIFKHLIVNLSYQFNLHAVQQKKQWCINSTRAKRIWQDPLDFHKYGFYQSEFSHVLLPLPWGNQAQHFEGSITSLGPSSGPQRIFNRVLPRDFRLFFILWRILNAVTNFGQSSINVINRTAEFLVHLQTAFILLTNLLLTYLLLYLNAMLLQNPRLQQAFVCNFHARGAPLQISMYVMKCKIPRVLNTENLHENLCTFLEILPHVKGSGQTLWPYSCQIILIVRGLECCTQRHRVGGQMGTAAPHFLTSIFSLLTYLLGSRIMMVQLQICTKMHRFR